MANGRGHRHRQRRWMVDRSAGRSVGLKRLAASEVNDHDFEFKTHEQVTPKTTRKK